MVRIEAVAVGDSETVGLREGLNWIKWQLKGKLSLGVREILKEHVLPFFGHGNLHLRQ